MIIYTSITNGYDEIPDSHYYDPDVQYVCFTDGTVEHKGPWEFREIPIEHECPLRRALYAKIMQHKVFPMGEQVVWIDGCYVMTEKYVEQSKKYFSESPRTHMYHPLKFSYYEEVLESYIAAFNTEEDILRITSHLNKLGFDFKSYVNPIMASFWNTVSEEAVEFNETWWELSQISTRCDQISFITSKFLTGLEWATIDDWTEPGVNFSGVVASHTPVGRVGRKKLHPQPAPKDQYRNRYELLKKLRPLVGMNPFFHIKHWRKDDKLEEWMKAHNIGP